MDDDFRWLLEFALAVDVAGPVAVLILVKRRTGRWQPAVRWCILTCTVLAFVATGGAEVMHRWHQYRPAAALNGRPPSELSDRDWLCFDFLVGGMFGVWFAAGGTAVGLVLLAGWRAAHASSFLPADPLPRRRTRR